MIPENARRRHGDVDEIYKVMKRKYGETENKEPQYVHVRSGESTLPSNVYEMMTNEQWKRTFNKYTSNRHFDMDIPTQTGHSRQFEDYVSNDPSNYLH